WVLRWLDPHLAWYAWPASVFLIGAIVTQIELLFRRPDESPAGQRRSGRRGRDWAAFSGRLIVTTAVLIESGRAIWYALRSFGFRPAFGPRELLQADRIMNMQTGVSPMVPVLFLALGVLIWACFQLERLYLVSSFRGDNPFVYEIQAGTSPQRVPGQRRTH